MAGLAKDHVDAIRDELDNVSARPLVDACIAHMVTAREGEGDLVREGDTQTFEDTIADAGDRLSAEIVKAASVSLDTQGPFILKVWHRHRKLLI